MMKTLKERGLEENTLVYFTSDHGSHIDLGPLGGSNGLFKGKWILAFLSNVCN